MTNNTYKFNINNDKNTYLCRVPVEGINEFVNRYDEKNILEALKDFNITEEVIAFDENSGIKISKFFEDAKTIDINDQNNLKSSMLILRRFHNLKVTVNVKNDIIKKLAECQETLMENGVDIAFTDYREVVKHSLEVINFVKKLKRIKTLTHGDPEAKNILFTYDGLRIIDFEYAGMTDPLSDIALFAIYSGFDEEEAFTLLKYYNEVDEKTNIAMTDINEEKAKRLVVCYMALGGLYSCLFAICRKSISGVDYGFYNMRMYRYFKDCYKYLKSNNIV
jgi:thiamine kinase-like enzyme